MKKVLFLQIKGNSCGGIWFVNKTIATAVSKKGYTVEVISVRNNPGDIIIETDLNFKIDTINKKDLWEIVRATEIKKYLKKVQIFKAFKLTILKIRDEFLLFKDYTKLKRYINNYNPNYIILSHYQLLDQIPKKYLSKTIMHHHNSFENLLESKNIVKKYKKYKDKIYSFLWLTKESCRKAKEHGFVKSTFIYNPIKFNSNEKADVKNNKKLITISRLSSVEKRIDLMIDIVLDLFKNEKYKNWSLELYGDGSLDEELLKKINSSSQINLMGLTKNPKEKLLTSSIYLSTSYHEGLPLSIIEAFECGIPAISYFFGESTYETIINDNTGYIVDFNDKQKFIEKLEYLMSNESKLNELSNNAKEYAKIFHINNIINKWIDLFDIIDDNE